MICGSRIGARLVVSAATLCAFITACGDPQRGRNLEQTNSQQTECVGNHLPAAIMAAIREVDAEALRSELAELQGQDKLQASLSLLEFWKCDLTNYQPSNRPTDYYLVRLAIAEFLAHAVRSQAISFPLDSFRDIAISRFAVSRSITEKIQAIPVIGISDSHQSISILEEFVLRNTESPGYQSQAITALSFICDSAARESLQRLASNPEIARAHTQAFERARLNRESLEKSWCRS